MTRDCISDDELKEVTNKLKQRNIKYCIHKNYEKTLFIRGHQVKYIINYDSEIEV